MKRSITTAMLITLVALSTTVARAQAAQEATIEPETKAKLILQTRLSSKLSEVGDPVTTVLDEPIYVGSQLVIPRGTEFRGRVTGVKAAGRGQKAGSLALTFEKVAMPWGDEPVFIVLAGIDDWDKNEKLKANDEGKVSGGHRGDKTVDNVIRGGGIGGAGAGNFPGEEPVAANARGDAPAAEIVRRANRPEFGPSTFAIGGEGADAVPGALGRRASDQPRIRSADDLCEDVLALGREGHFATGAGAAVELQPLLVGQPADAHSVW